MIQSRRRALLTANAGRRAAPEPEVTRIQLDYSGGWTETPGMGFYMNDGSPMTGGLMTTQQNIPCLRMPAGSYILIERPCYQNEALELECYLPQPNVNNGPILSCGDGAQSFAAMQWYWIQTTQMCYIKRFASPVSAVNFNYSKLVPTTVNRRFLRIERRGTEIKYFVNLSAAAMTPYLAETRNDVGTVPPTDYDPAMAGLGLRTGVAFPQNNAYLAKLRWEKLED